MFIVLDGSYYVFRAFYALRHMRNSKGMPTNGLYAFTNMLLNVVRDHEPEYLAVAFDPPGPVFRNRMYPEYKANRDAPPEDLVPQFPYFRDIVEALEIPILEVPDFEADDLLGAAAKFAEAQGLECMILSGDKDLAQLVTERTTLYDSMRDKKVGIAEVLERFQVAPAQVADVLGLAGDTSDNIPGVPGIGEKTAGKLIAEFGSLDEVLANIDKVSGKKRKENLATFAEQARLSRDLATIVCDVPVRFELDALRVAKPNFRAFDALCHELEFRRFPGVARAVFGTDDAPAETTKVEIRSRVVDSADALRSAVANARKAKATSVVAFGDEGADGVRVSGVALSWTPDEGVYVPLGGATPSGQLSLTSLGDGGDGMSAEAAAEALRPLIEDPDVALLVHDAKALSAALAPLGLTPAGVRTDTLLAAYLLDPNRRDFGTETLAREYLGRQPSARVDLLGSGRKARAFADATPEELAPYCVEQAAAVGALDRVLRDKLGDVATVHDTMELPLSGVLARMEQTGIRVDVDRLAEMSTEFHAQLETLTADIHGMAGHPFTINSPKQLGVVLFEELGLPVQKKGKSGPSTDASVLEALAPEHEIAAAVLRHRELSKLASTYVDALPKLVRAATGRVHTHFNQAVAATGRLSSSDPNLQNIPVRTAEGRRIREAFVPAPGWLLIGADYSQIELRVLAHMCQDPVLVDAFVRGDDIHRRTAAEVLEVSPDAITSEQRAAAKAINFGLIYGMGVNRLSNETPLSRAEAKAYIERYFDRISGVKPFMDGLVEIARGRGYAETLVGRRRPIPELVYAENRRSYALGERLAKNTPIQGTAADIIKLAMIKVQRALDAAAMQTRMLLTVHDELVFECPPEEQEAALSLIRAEMEGAFELSVPLSVEAAVGASWAELK